MKVDTFFKHKFDFNQFIPVIDGQLTTYQLESDHKGTLANGGGQTYIYSDEPLMINAQIRDVKDAGGTLTFTDSYGSQYYVYVNSCEPVINVFGRVTAYRSTLRRTPPASLSLAGLNV